MSPGPKRPGQDKSESEAESKKRREAQDRERITPSNDSTIEQKKKRDDDLEYKPRSGPGR